jgi:hypothetical protein
MRGQGATTSLDMNGSASRTLPLLAASGGSLIRRPSRVGGRAGGRQLLAGLLLLLCACSSRDPREPEGAFKLWLDALHRRSCPDLYARLDNQSLDEVAATYAASRSIHQILMSQYPEKERTAEMRNQELLAHVKESEDPRSFFLAWCAHEFPVDRIGGGEVAGARVDRVESDPSGDKVTLISKAGDKYRLSRRSDGTWGVDWLYSDYHKVAEAQRRNLGIVRERGKGFTARPGSR